MASLIGALRVSLSADTAQFDEGMRRARASSKQTAGYIRTTLGGVGVSVREGLAGIVAGLSVGLFTAVIKKSLEYAGSLAEVAQQLGVTAKDLQVFRYAAGQVGVSQEQLETGLSKLTITLGKVAAGAEAPTKALNAIGISADQLKGKDAGEAFRIIADGLQKVTDRSQRAAVEVALFGKTGSSLDNLLSGGSSALNALADAAEKLGIVLSDDQIARADETADKLEALKTVLSANIASEVANNTDAILALADALLGLVRASGQAVQGWKTIIGELQAGLPSLKQLPNPVDVAAALAGDPAAAGRVFKGAYGAVGAAAGYENSSKGLAKKQALDKLMSSGWSWINNQRKPKIPAGTDIDQFLAPKGAKPKHAREDHSAENALREQHQFSSEMDRAQQDILRAQQSLATDYRDRAAISLQMIDAEKASYDADLDYQVQLHELTKGKQGLTQVQADQLRLLNNQKVALDKQAVAQDVLAQQYEDKVRFIQTEFDIQRDQLQAESQLADTAAEQRDIQLRLLDLSYRQEKARLQAVLADEKASVAAKDDAQARLNAMDDRYAADRAGVIKGTRGPLEQWAASVPQSAAQINEAFQSIEANGIEGLSNAISGVISGTESLKDAFGSLAKSIIADLIQMTVKMLVFRALSSALGMGGVSTPGLGGADVGVSGLSPGSLSSSFAIPGFATGGGFNVLGRKGTDRNMLALNGLPIARVSHGERVNIGNDNVNTGPQHVVIELRDEMLDAKIATGAGVQIARTYPMMRADTLKAVNEKARRR
jgi:hypothetical protein